MRYEEAGEIKVSEIPNDRGIPEVIKEETGWPYPVCWVGDKAMYFITKYYSDGEGSKETIRFMANISIIMTLLSEEEREDEQ